MSVNYSHLQILAPDPLMKNCRIDYVYLRVFNLRMCRALDIARPIEKLNLLFQMPSLPASAKAPKVKSPGVRQ